MNVQQLFEAIGSIDDRYIEEAASDNIPHVKWKIAAVAAAAAAVIAGTVLYSTAILSRPAASPQDLSAPTPVVTAAATQPPAPEASEPVSVTPEGGSDTTTPPPEQTPEPTPAREDDPATGWSGVGLPGLPGSGLPSLPGSGGSGSGALPGIGMPVNPAEYVAYTGRYSHTAAGDFLVFYEPHGIPVLTKNITGQIIDGCYSATVSGFPFGGWRYVQLQVYEDGSYDLTIS